MSFLQTFSSFAKKGSKNIGLGLGSDIKSIQRMVKVVNIISQRIDHQFFFVTTSSIANTHLLEQIIEKLCNSKIHLILTENPSSYLITHLFSSLIKNPGLKTQTKALTFDAIIRGSLSSSDFLLELKCFKEKYQDIFQKNVPLSTSLNRLALLESAQGYQFYFAGVGIDEINSINQKINFIRNSVKFFEKLHIQPKIALLSGGRDSDLGRDSIVDISIQDIDKIIDKIKNEIPNLNIYNAQILIEDTISDKANLIIPPDGISGNLIYRTLIHLGGGKSYGALYLEEFLKFNKIIIDSSRVAPEFEIEGAIYFALGISHFL